VTRWVDVDMTIRLGRASVTRSDARLRQTRGLADASLCVCEREVEPLLPSFLP
jgi:hypothetical protein